MTTARRISAVFTALAANRQMAVLLLLAEKPRRAEDVVKVMRVPLYTCRHMLLALRRAGLVESRLLDVPGVAGRVAVYRLAGCVAVADDALCIDVAGFLIGLARSIGEGEG